MRPVIFFLCLFTFFNTSYSKENALKKSNAPAEVVQSTKVGGVPIIILKLLARKRLGIEARIFKKQNNGAARIPFSSLIYDTEGVAWVYVEASPLKFHRERIKILLTAKDSLKVETDFDDRLPIVTIGAAELNGTEFGVGK